MATQEPVAWRHPEKFLPFNDKEGILWRLKPGHNRTMVAAALAPFFSTDVQGLTDMATGCASKPGTPATQASFWAGLLEVLRGMLRD